ncbi:MAG: HEAT repeat domain-containing protein [Planctomycetes bacterium]|nr:HEAT repeat domain-containing protein [Planctomycetota bacterium]
MARRPSALSILLAAALAGCSQEEPGPRALRASAAAARAVSDVGAAQAGPDERDQARVVLRGHPDPRARRAAIDQLTAAADVGPLVEVLLTDEDPLVRRWAALALERAVQADGRAWVRPALAQALCAEPDRAVRAVLGRLERRLAATPS